MELCPDGLVRLTLNEMLSMSLIHLTSGVDQEVCGQRSRCGTVAPITGYTEWTSVREPVITIGWDWESVSRQSQACLERVGLPRCNILLVDLRAITVSRQRQLEIVGTMIDAMDWQTQLQTMLAERYGPGRRAAGPQHRPGTVTVPSVGTTVEQPWRLS